MVKQGRRSSRAGGKGVVHKSIFFTLLVIIMILVSMNVAKAKGWLIPEQENINIVANTITLNSLTLEQKIAQMIVVAGDNYNLESWKKMQLGGVHLFALQDEQLFLDATKKIQEGQQIPFFITVDLEGCLNPFANYKTFLPTSEVSTLGEAFEKGTNEGRYLQSLGITLNFAPVVDLSDNIWKCRTFPGDKSSVSELAEAYILGLQNQGVIATAKHYPGKTLIGKDPHKNLVTAVITSEDIYPYDELADTTKGIMVSHVIASGEVDSEGNPSVVSEKIIAGLKQKYKGLVISDEINMLGLKDFYPHVDEMYIAVFKAGNDLILNFNDDPNEIYRMIQIVTKSVEQGTISEEQIDASVKRILEAKGFIVH